MITICPVAVRMEITNQMFPKGQYLCFMFMVKDAGRLSRNWIYAAAR